LKVAGNPWMKFYPSDWRADAMLRLCSIGARGLWAEMMCIMHDAEPYGSLLVNGKRIDKKQLAGLAAVSEKDCVALLIELEGNGVFSRDHDGTIYSRRMRRDYQKAIKDKANGKNGGNPRLKGGVNPPDNGGDKAQKPEATSQIDRIGSAGASAFTEASNALAEAFLKSFGFDTPLKVPLEFSGVHWRALSWESAGWPADMIDAEARRIGPDKPLTYYEKVFATAFAKRQAPLPIVQVREAETVKVIHGTSKTSLIAAIDRRLAELDTEAGNDFALSENPVRRISG
jgi:hypothetical protein